MGGRIKRSVTSLPLDGKTVLVRADLDVPLGTRGMQSSLVAHMLPTLRYLTARHCKVVLVGHISRPDGFDVAFSTKPLAKLLANQLQLPVHYIGAVTGPKVRMAVKRAPKGSVLLLENLRFEQGEEQNSEAFAKALVYASGADYFVQDDKRAVKRTAASTVSVPKFVPSVAGFNVIDVWDGPGMKHLLDA